MIVYNRNVEEGHEKMEAILKHTLKLMKIKYKDMKSFYKKQK